MEEQAGAIEYLTEWPPKEICSETSPLATDCLPPKRPRYGETNTQTTHSMGMGMGHTDWDGMGMGLVDKEEDDLCCGLHPHEVSLVESVPSLKTDTLLARWWKFKSKQEVEHMPADQDTDGSSSHSGGGPGSCHILRIQSVDPHTQLFHIARLSEAKKVLKCRINHLKSLLNSEETISTSYADIHASLAACYMRLGTDTDTLSCALKHSKIANEMEPSNSEMKWITQLLLRQQRVEQLKHKAELRLGRTLEQNLAMPNAIQVERRSAEELSYKEFHEGYAQTHTPLIITGVVEHMVPAPWRLSYIRQAIGEKIAPLKQMMSDSVCWARLEPAKECRVSDFIDSLDNSTERRYLFDWSLPINCPQLVKELSIPKYFANDFLQQTPVGSVYRDSWPSLFVAPARVTSELHVDAFGSNFWMALFEGKKRWIFFPPDDVPLLYPIYNHSTDAVFDVNLAKPDIHKHPLLTLTHPRECILQPGELLFVPAGCPHRVENLEKSLAISANFVDSSNFELVKKELQVNALVDERAEQLLRVYESRVFHNKVDVCFEKNLCVTWEHFKSQKYVEIT